MASRREPLRDRVATRKPVTFNAREHTMADRYYVETFEPGSVGKGFHEEFEAFDAAFQAATAKASLQPDREVRIHLPADATDEQRRQVVEAGWKLA